MDILHQKRELRQIMKARRAEAHARNPQAGRMLRGHVLENFSPPPRAVIAAYRAFGSEIDPAPLVEALRARGHVIALPVAAAKNQPMIFRRYEAGDALAVSAFGVAEPLAAAPPVDPDLLLVPLVAFDRAGFRLGYGGGFYDRAIRRLRGQRPVVALGLAFACQEVLEIPRTIDDARLDNIVTDIEFVR